MQIAHDLNLTVLSIVGIYAFQCCFAEYFISCFLQMNLRTDILIDLVMCGIFTASGWYLDNVFCMVIYGAAYLAFIFLQRKQVKQTIAMIRKIEFLTINRYERGSCRYRV